MPGKNTKTAGPKRQIKIRYSYKIFIYSDLFYNMQFCIKESNILEDGYKKINSFLNN